MKKILFVGGGTGGHIIPLLAVMAEVTGAELHYAGSAKDMAFPAIKASPLEFERHVIRTGKLNRSLTLRHIPEGYAFMAGIGDAWKLIRQLRPDVIFAKGGAVSVPIAWAAARMGIPVYCHETDVASGLANRLVARYAKTVFTAFPAENYAFSQPVVYVGQPVRPVFREENGLPLVINGIEIADDLPLIAVTGGSQGARGLNSMVCEAWPMLLTQARLVQLCGPLDIHALQQAKQELPEDLQTHLTLLPFLGEEFPQLIKQATVVVSRSGGTIFELAAAGKASVLVPLPTAAQDHQRKNAAVLQRAGAVVVVQQKEAPCFEKMIIELVSNASEREMLRKAIQEFDRPHAAGEMAKYLTR